MFSMFASWKKNSELIFLFREEEKIEDKVETKEEVKVEKKERAKLEISLPKQPEDEEKKPTKARVSDFKSPRQKVGVKVMGQGRSAFNYIIFNRVWLPNNE